MKDDINLLPPPIHRARIHALVTRQRDRIVYTFLLGLLFIAAAYAVNWYALYQTELTIQSELTNLDTEMSMQADEVIHINAFTHALAERVLNSESWTERAVQALQRLPADMKVTRLSSVAAIVERQPADALIVEGTSNTRESLAKFEAHLNSLPWVVHLEAPLGNLAGNKPPFLFSFVAFHTDE